MNKTTFLLMIIFFFSISVINSTDKKKDAYNYVDPFIGTRTPGHTFPGAMLPFGMVQLSPDTRNDHTSWPSCAGYDYDDGSIVGFSHTHLSGTGVPDLGDFLFMPIAGEVKTTPGTLQNPDLGYRSRFSHNKENAEPGYYRVFLEDYNIDVELTTTERVGFHKYTYPLNSNREVLIDLSHRDPVRESFMHIISDTEIAGYRRSKAWAGDQYQYFYAKFNQPIVGAESFYDNKKSENFAKFYGEKVLSVLSFSENSDKPLLVKVGISAVSIEGAKKNLEQEIDHWNFNKVRSNAKSIWKESLNKIQVAGGSEKEKTVFYTALYHSLLTPNIYNDVDGKYRGMDSEIHFADGFTNYTVFSLWDTFRALHPLLTIIEPERTRDMVVSLQNKFEQFGELPMWELHSNDTRCMIGYHAVSMMADAYVKGINDFDVNKVLNAMVQSANVKKRGIDQYKELGFVPTNKGSQSVSKTLEYAYDDWCIAEMAKVIGNTEIYNEFSKRARFFENLYDPQTKFMRPRYSNRKWYENFNPQSVGKTYNFNFTEGNSYQYSLFVPHDIYTVKSLVGGDEKFDEWLDDLFKTEMNEKIDGDSDVSGLFGQYSHGNEPSHHMAYLYNYAGKPWKSQKIVRKILNDLYDTSPEGICGNDDCGQMSAWYIMSAMGFYSVCPGRPEYVLGSPIFDNVKIKLSNGNIFEINSKNNSVNNIYIDSMKLNDVLTENTFINHKEIIEGGKIDFTMSNIPNTKRGRNEIFRPKSDTKNVVKIPYQNSNHTEFIDEKIVELKTETEDADIYYTLDNSTPNIKSIKYTKPFKIKESTLIKAIAVKSGMSTSIVALIDFEKVTSIKINSDRIKPGLQYKYYEGIFRSVYDFANEKPEKFGIVKNITVSVIDRDEWIGISFNGLIMIPENGLYEFEIAANDGAQLKINNKELFESDGRKSFAFTQSNQIYLTKGFHKIDVKYFQCSDRKKLEVSWKRPGGLKEKIPAEFLFYKN